MGIFQSLLDSYIRLNGAFLCFLTFRLFPICPNQVPSPTAGAASRPPSITTVNTPAPTLRPTFPLPTFRPTVSPTLGPSPRPTTECHLVDNPRPLPVEPGTNLVVNVRNRLVPDACILRSTCGHPALFANVVAFFELVGTSVPQARLQASTADGLTGVNVALIVAGHIDGPDSEGAFCAGVVVNPPTPEAAEVLVTTGRQESRGLRQFVVLSPSQASGPLQDDFRKVRVRMLAEVCAGIRVINLDVAAHSVGSTLTFLARNQAVSSSSCSIGRCTQSFPNGNISLVLRISNLSTGSSVTLRAQLGSGIPYSVATVNTITNANAACGRQITNLDSTGNSEFSVNSNDGFLVLAPANGLSVDDGTPWTIEFV